MFHLKWMNWCYTALAGFAVTLRLDKRDGERLFWASPYADPSSANYLQLEWESNQAVSNFLIIFLNFIYSLLKF